MTNHEPDDLVAVAEAAKIAKVSRVTLRAYADAGLVPCLRTLGGHRRFRVGDLGLLTEAEYAAKRGAA